MAECTTPAWDAIPTHLHGPWGSDFIPCRCSARPNEWKSGGRTLSHACSARKRSESLQSVVRSGTVTNCRRHFCIQRVAPAGLAETFGAGNRKIAQSRSGSECAVRQESAMRWKWKGIDYGRPQHRDSVVPRNTDRHTFFQFCAQPIHDLTL